MPVSEPEWCFQNLNQVIQSELLDLASSLATEIHELNEQVFIDGLVSTAREVQQ